MSGFAGFDVSAYPGDDVMKALKAKSNFSWCGFYLGPAPSHGESDWMSKRTTLRKQGWGLAPVYVGSQTGGPGVHDDSGMQGQLDGRQCAFLMGAAGLAPGRVVFIDLENGLPMTSPETAYLEGWAENVVAAGYAVGVYCSHTMAPAVAGGIRAVAAKAQAAERALLLDAEGKPRLWCWKIPHNPFGPPYSTDAPAGCGYPDAVAWQHDQNVEVTIGGFTVVVDLNTSLTHDPSDP